MKNVSTKHTVWQIRDSLPNILSHFTMRETIPNSGLTEVNDSRGDI